MSFREAYLKGQEALDGRNQSKIEICKIFEKMRNEIYEEYQLDLYLKWTTINGFILLAQSTNDPIEVLKLTLYDAGYPCSIIWGWHSRSCRNPKEVSGVLCEFLSDPGVGAVFNRILEDKE